MAAAALHHAGIKAVKIEDLERKLRTDMMNESIAWGGKVLLHKEVEKATIVPRVSFESERTFSLRRFRTLRMDQSHTTNAEVQEDITKTTSYQPTTYISAFWEPTGAGGDIDSVRIIR